MYKIDYPHIVVTTDLNSSDGLVIDKESSKILLLGN
jgi:hypothetical protein